MAQGYLGVLGKPKAIVTSWLGFVMAKGTVSAL